jgi:hypothetical protein
MDYHSSTPLDCILDWTVIPANLADGLYGVHLVNSHVCAGLCYPANTHIIFACSRTYQTQFADYALSL